MTVNPSPFFITLVARQRRDELLAEADRYRLAQHAAGKRSALRQPRAGRPLMVVAAVALALLAAASAIAEEPLRRDRSSPGHTDGRDVTQVLDEHLLDPTTARQISAARW